MKIVRNIPGFMKLLYCLRYFEAFRKDILKAREAGDLEEERRQILAATSLWGPMMFKMFGSTLNVEGKGNIPEKGPVLIVSNHQGYCDIPALFSVFTRFQFAFVAKDDLGKLPFYGKWIKRIRSVMMDRGDTKAAFAAIKKGIEYINDGFSLAVFPEGTRSKGSVPGPFLRGPLKLATKPGVPIVPVSINGTYRIFEEKGVFTPSAVDVIVHEPLETAGLSRREEADLNDTVERIIKEGVAELAARTA